MHLTSQGQWLNRLVLAIVSALVAVGGALPFILTLDVGRGHHAFDIELASDTPGSTQLYFDLGDGYRDADSSVQPIAVKPDKTVYRYLLPSQPIRGFRLSVVDRPAVTRLGEARVVQGRKSLIRKFGMRDYEFPTCATFELGAELLMDGRNCPGGPAIELTFPEPLNLELSLGDRVWLSRWLILGLFVSALALGAAVNRFGSKLLTVAGRTTRYPKTTLAAVSFIAVAVQCHPVLFAGRSFVSPNNGSPMLYERHPTLPGLTETVVEDTKGSDVAAMFHNTLYYPAIQHDALFEHGELPLWNRYSMSGLPLLGQGQSMFGSLLNFIPVLFDASAGSWDARYVLNRWLHAFTVGLAVWLLTGCVLSGSVMSVAGLFIGFFGFRLNHMAQFSLESATLITVGWILLRQATTRPATGLALLVLVFGHWEVLNSGTVKEAYSFILFLDLLGVLLVATSLGTWRMRGWRLGAAVAAGIVFLLLSAPILATFFGTLVNTVTASDVRHAFQAPQWQFVAFFDDILYSRLNPGEIRVLPTVNFIVFLLIAAALVRLRREPRNSGIWCSLAVFMLAAAMVFEGFSPLFLRSLPWIGNIHHVHNVGSASMILTGVILAGYGVDTVRRLFLEEKAWRIDLPLIGVLMAVPLWVYFARSSETTASPFVQGYLASNFTSLGIFFAAVLLWQFRRSQGVVALAILSLATTALWRHAHYVTTPFDPYVVNLHERPDFKAPSAAVEAVNQLSSEGPARPAGMGLVIFAGYSGMLGWESVFGVDAIRSEYYDELAGRGGLNKLLWVYQEKLLELGGEPNVWHEDNLDLLLPIHDLLNVRYYLAHSNWKPNPAGSLRQLGSYDLDVYESPTAWPRAFFTDRLMGYNDVRHFVRRLRQLEDRRPFAAMARDEAAGHGLNVGTVERLRERIIQPASRYVLTANTTSFRISAPTAGVAVLTENYIKDDFRAYLNGKAVPVLRVNHSFKGVTIPQAGDYEVRFEYWPRYFTASLWAFLAGVVLAGLLAFWFSAPTRRRWRTLLS